MHIAVIDDGVNEEFWDSPIKLRENIVVEDDLTIKKRLNYDTRKPSHGTVCAGIITCYTTNVELSSIKILDKNKKGNVKQLLRAIEYCGKMHVDIIHLSIGSTDYRDYWVLLSAVNKAYEKGMIIVAAASNSQEYSILTEMENVIGVRNDNKLVNNQFYVNGKDGGFYASSRHFLRTHSGELFKTLVCNSFAAPVITAEIHNLIRKKGNGDVCKSFKEFTSVKDFNKDTGLKLVQEPYFLGQTVIFSDVPIIRRCLVYDVQEIYPLDMLNTGVSCESAIVLNSEERYNKEISKLLSNRNCNLKNVILLRNISMKLKSVVPIRLHIRNQKRYKLQTMAVKGALEEPPIIIMTGEPEKALPVLGELEKKFEKAAYTVFKCSDYEMGFLYGLRFISIDLQFEELIRVCNFLKCDLVLYYAYKQETILKDDVRIKITGGKICIEADRESCICSSVDKLYDKLAMYYC